LGTRWGCIATGATVAETETEIRDAIRFHIEGWHEDALPVPPPSPAPNKSTPDRWSKRTLPFVIGAEQGAKRRSAE
jgi:hypothetical protein